MAKERPPAPAPNRILAIDGPAGAGKSTVAARMAERFGLLHLETGAMYRAFALKALAAGVSPDDEAALTALSRETTLTLLPGPAGNRVLLDGAEVAARLRTPEVADAASRLSVHPPVRRWMVGLQQALGAAASGGVVMEGRDIGTVVFPRASIKIFLSASPEARSARRSRQNGGQASAQVLRSLQERDARDQGRAESPLRPAPDAVEIDSTGLSAEQVAARVEALVRTRWGLAGDPEQPLPRPES